MTDALYDTDVLIWSEQQADLLRRAARGERVNGLDWPNLIEEIEDVGRAELHAVESLLEQALVHLLKMAVWPADDAAGHWHDEVLAFLSDVTRRYSPAMRQRLDMDDLYRRAVRRVRRSRLPGPPPTALPPACPITLDDLLTDDPDPAALAQRLTAAANG